MNNRRRIRQSTLESLESRNLLAAASFSLQLYESGDDGPANEIVGPVTAGESFYVEVSAIEHDPLARGIGGVALNLKWDPSQIALVEEDFDLSEILSPDLPLFRGGDYDQQLGRIYDLRASQIEAFGAGRSVGDGEIESIAMLHFRSLGSVSDGEIRVWEGASEIVPASNGNWQRGDIEFEVQNLSVAEANDQPIASEPESSEPESSEPESSEPESSEPESSEPESSEPSAGGNTDAELNFEATNDNAETAAAKPSDDAGSQLPTPVDGYTFVDVAEDAMESEPDEAIEQAGPEAEAGPKAEAGPEAEAGPVPFAPAIAAESIDQALSFDMNQDGIFDFADFGLLNQSALSLPVDAVVASETETPTVADEGVPEEPKLDFHVFCTAAPPRSDVAQFEKWLDALAAAWIADAKAREIRDDQQLASHQNTPSVLG